MSRRCLALALIASLAGTAPAVAKYVAIPSPGPESVHRFLGLRLSLRLITALAAVRIVWVER